ncbi:TetR family transcriptional regulator [Amycolatopsis sp. WAC 01375]|uniref:TetR/AcrR family transcriptional regulator n=1 Tax=unclassified Amycolatopsis TaxID=2618356 RepID=UPI000F78D709|nr:MULTISPECIES: TetR/AcrR family transcriptional regulator [unclassified Amycolatopsis]RSM79938.1 TetR family transcriptional regulator [Amycolatopsis sp. WAC 01375]RSN27483.1 TetR family transcriptional regulator [Amycolatopsis sp. WAC 01416]
MTKVTAPRGRVDKRQAILDVAFTVFARRGYARASVQEIADEAKVAKPTVYNHFSDKETLFRGSMAAAADGVAADSLDAIGPLRDAGADVRAALGTAASRLLRICSGERSHALRSLAYAELATFPELVVAMQERTSVDLTEALADRFARLALSGALRSCDPARAAEHFLALLIGPLESRSRLGARVLPESELEGIAESAVDTFVRAYGL